MKKIHLLFCGACVLFLGFSGCLKNGVIGSNVKSAQTLDNNTAADTTGTVTPSPVPSVAAVNVPAIVPADYGGNSRVFARVFLAGAYNSTTGKMNTTLNTNGVIPLNNPYGNEQSLGIAPAQGASLPAGFLAANPDIVDWIQIELRVGTHRKNTVVRKSVLVDSSGNVRDLDGTLGVPVLVKPGDYYLIIRHRNHLTVMTKAPITLSLTSALADLTAAQTTGCTNTLTVASPGDCLKQITPGVFAMYGGDVNQDGQVIYDPAIPHSDRNEILYVILGGSISTVLPTTYSPGDLNMNGMVRFSGPGNDPNALLGGMLSGESTARISGNPDI